MQPEIDGTEPDASGRASNDALAALRRFAAPRPQVERCELCGAAIAGEHPHLLERSTRQVACSCDACAILFCGQEGARYLRVPRRVIKQSGLTFSDQIWDQLSLPINLAFFLRRSNGSTAVLYPSPGGVMESLVQMPLWQELFANDITLSSAEPEVEVLLVNRIAPQASAPGVPTLPASASGSYLVPIDTAYRLVGLIRTRWRGLSGGAEVWKSIADFFANLEGKANPSGAAHA